MKKTHFKALLTGSLMTFIGIQNAHTQARVQVIHNSADAMASQVDVYLGSALILNDFSFRTATPFQDVPSGTPITIGIAPSTSSSVGDVFASFTYTLTAGATYVIVADGIESSTGYSPAPAFDLKVYATGRELASQPGETDVLVHHGSTDAPMVDVVETGVGAGTIVDDAAYADFAGYLELPTDDYVLEIRDASGTVTVASYDAPLASLGLQDSALVVVASGFLNPAANSGGPSFGLWAALPSGGNLIPLPVSMARAQVIHNSADAAAEKVDVYLGSTQVLNDFAFRTATPFIDLPAGVPIAISIAPDTSTSVASALETFNFTLQSGATYVIVADGIVSPTGYSPAPTFDLKVYNMGREEAANAGETDVLVHHGSTDAPVVDVVETGVGAGTVVNNAAYGDFAGYLELPTDDYVLEVRDATGTVTVASYDAPLASLGLQDSALVVVASGFLNPAANSGGPAFGLWVALASGGEMVQLPASTARVQVIHNSADAAANEVDVYLGSTQILNNFAFRTATPFVNLPAGIPIAISVAPDTSTSVASALETFNLTLQSGATYVVVADGIVSATGYTPAPPFDLKIYNMGREEAANAGETDVLVHHGSTDAPTVDVVETGVGAGTIVDDAAYGDFAGYLELPTNDYVLEIRDETGATTVASFLAPLSSADLQDSAIVVVASGFLNPAANSGGPSFGLWVALASGGDMIQLLATPTSVNDLNNQNTNLVAYPNPASDQLTLTQNGEVINTVKVFDAKGALVTSLNPFTTSIVLPVQSLDNGMYFVETMSNTGINRTKVQVNR